MSPIAALTEIGTTMKWTLHLRGNDFSVYEFVSETGANFTCKYNKGQGSLRLRFEEQRAVYNINEQHVTNRKVPLLNVYGSEVGLINKNLWRENTGTVTFDESLEEIQYAIDSHNYIVEITKADTTYCCDLNAVPHPAREQHFMPVIIAFSWLQTLQPRILKSAIAQQ